MLKSQLENLTKPYIQINRFTDNQQLTVSNVYKTKHLNSGFQWAITE